jgi:hypothetical protein
MTTTFTPVLPATREIPRQPLRCIGRYDTHQGGVDYEISWEDAARDAVWAERALTMLGVVKGEFVAVVSTGHEAPWYGPLLDALYRRGATVCPLEPAPYEQGRAEMFFRRFPIAHVIGLDAELCGELEACLGLQFVFARVRTIIARPEAFTRIRDFAGAKGLILPLGPAFGLPCREAPMVHLDPDEWQIENADEGIAITALKARATRPVRQVLAAEGTVVPEHRCGCGLGSSVYTPRLP